VLETGNVHDAKIFNKNIASFMYEPGTLVCSKNAKFQQYFLADAGYDSKFIRELLIDKGYKVIIPKNKRNTKNIKVDLNEEYKKGGIYKKRMIVENMFSTIKQHRRLNNIYEKYVGAYNMYLYLVLSKILVNKQNQ
jgi:transposase